MEGGRRWRRVARGVQTVLPLQRSTVQISNTVSCWYCDFKVTAFNYLLYSLGHRNARILRVWYAIGVCFSLTILVGVTLTLFWSQVQTFLLGGTLKLPAIWLFSIESHDQNLSLADVVIMIYSTLVAVVVHEFGHALAAASQGIQVEYVAMFVACIFPGAFVAFNYEALLNSSLMTALRIYCAGIWHNVVFCAICALTLFFLSVVLDPLYLYGQGPVVLDVAATSPLSGYLSQGDGIVTLDGTIIHTPQQWREKLVKMDIQHLNGSTMFEASCRKGYCVPDSWLDGSSTFQSQDGSSCPSELTNFVNLSCSLSSPLQSNGVYTSSSTAKQAHCLIARDVVKLQKCGYRWQTAENQGNCSCLEGESCMAPVESRGQTWIEISIKRPHSPECLINSRSSGPLWHPNIPLSQSPACGGTLVFVGDAMPLLGTVLLSSYQPRWAGRVVSLYFPFYLEKLFSSMLHISASLALFNSLPAFFLDGESIVEACCLEITWLRQRWRRRLTKLILYGGTFLVACILVQILFILL